MTPSDAFRELLYRHIRRTATNGVFRDAMTDTAATLDCTRDKVKTAIRALVRHGMLTIETQGAGRLASEYRIVGASQILETTEPTPRRFDVILATVLSYATEAAVDGAFEARVCDIASACRISIEQTKKALERLQQDRSMKQVYRGTGGRLTRYLVGDAVCDDEEDAEEPEAPLDSARFVAAFRVSPVVDRVRLVAPGTYPASGYSMLRARP